MHCYILLAWTVYVCWFNRLIDSLYHHSNVSLFFFFFKYLSTRQCFTFNNIIAYSLLIGNAVQQIISHYKFIPRYTGSHIPATMPPTPPPSGCCELVQIQTTSYDGWPCVLGVTREREGHYAPGCACDGPGRRWQLFTQKSSLFD